MSNNAPECRICGSTHIATCRHCGHADVATCDGDCYWMPVDCCIICDDALANLERDIEQLLYKEVDWNVVGVTDGLRELGVSSEIVLDRVVITTPGGPLSLWAEGDPPFWCWTEPASTTTDLASRKGTTLASTLAKLAWIGERWRVAEVTP